MAILKRPQAPDRGVASPLVVIDGGDLGCGELLLVVYRRVRDLPADTVIAITTSDPAAVIDIPAWCHLTGHRYRGSQRDAAGVAYLVEIARQRNPVDPQMPWHLPTATESTR
ncbi:MAG: sulfurtransferase TusA family protein [Nocardioides sp.]